MSETDIAGDVPTLDVPVDSMAPRTLKDRLDEGEPVTILDVRAESEFDEWHIDGPAADVHNIPYFEFIDGADAAPMDAIPTGDPVVVVCAKGQSSEFVAGLIEKETAQDAVNLADGMNGWADLYESREITRYDGSGTLLQYQRPSSGCLGYLLIEGESAAVIDPLRRFTDRYRDDADTRGADLEYALDTHIHADHISGVRTLADGDVEGVLPEATTERPVAFESAVTLLADGETMEVGDATIEAIHTPGHTTGMTSYLLDDSVLLTGDGLFVESVARPDLEKGDEGAPDAAGQLYDSIQERILTVDDDVVVAGGHASDTAETAEDGTYTATIGELTEEMEALSLSKDEFVDLVLSDMPPRPANYEDIIATNLGQQSIADDEAFRLELGPNNCATSEGSLRE
ncbi:MAG: MBL fold metallo-hydrolase [Halodesulfurarchaeum sp.]